MKRVLQGRACCLVMVLWGFSFMPSGGFGQANPAQPLPDVRPLSKENSRLIDQARPFIAGADAKQKAEAIRAVERLRDKVGHYTSIEIEHLLASTWFADKQLERAWSHVGPFLRDRLEYRSAWVEIYFLGGEIQLTMGKPLDAALIYDFIIRGEEKRPNDGSGGSKHIPRAAEGAGRAFLATRIYTQAEYSFKFGLDYVEKQLKSYKSELKDLIALLNAGLKTARRAAAVEKYGEDFVLYRDAETQRRKHGNYDKARELFLALLEVYPDSVFAEPSSCFEALCLIESNKPDQVAEGERRLLAFYSADKNGLYRGEALYHLARLALERHIEPVSAGKHLAALDDWIAQARKRWPPEKAQVPPAQKSDNVALVREKADSKTKVKTIPGAKVPPVKTDDTRLDNLKSETREVVRPPENEWKKPDFWGNVKPEEIAPGELVNPQTCTWYLNNLEEHCAKFRGFLAFAKGDKNQAHEQFRRLLALDHTLVDGELRSNPNDYTRLKFGAEHGYLVCYPQELKLYNPKQQLLIKLGDLYYVTGQFSYSRVTFRRVLNGELGKLESAQEDYLHYMMGQLANQDNDGTDVFVHYEKVLDRKDGTWTELRAAWAIMSRGRSFDGQRRDQSNALLREMAYSKLDNQYVHEARLLLSLDLLHDNNTEEATRVLKLIPQSNTKCHTIAQARLTSIADPDSSLWRFLGKTTD